MITYVKVYFIDGKTDAGVDTRDAVNGGEIPEGVSSWKNIMRAYDELLERMKDGTDEDDRDD